jgi:DNA invertase Pin-like site-specific DNA recombinase
LVLHQNEQGESGLGLQAQRRAVTEYLARKSGKFLCEFVEVESGSRNDRLQQTDAIELCKRYKAILLIAKLDRLARNVAFISRLMESGLDFVAVDNPHANKLMIHLLAAFAEHERDQIRARNLFHLGDPTIGLGKHRGDEAIYAVEKLRLAAREFDPQSFG